MSLLTAPLNAAGRCADDLARLLLPIGLVDRLSHRGPHDVGLWLDDDEVLAADPSDQLDPAVRADRARARAAAYLSRRRSELQRDLDRRR